MKKDTLFSEQAKANEQVAKDAMTKVITDTIAKHVETQEMLTRIVSAGYTKCLECSINKLGGRAAHLTTKVNELINTYFNLFGEEFPSKTVTDEQISKIFPLAKGEPSYNPYDESTWWMHPELHSSYGRPSSETPGKSSTSMVRVPINSNSPSSEDIENIIASALKDKLPPNTQISVVNSASIFQRNQPVFGLYPADFDGFQEFYAAIKEKITEWRAEGRDEDVKAEMERLVGQIDENTVNSFMDAASSVGPNADLGVISLKKSPKKNDLNT
jgi:hypothetical protein